MTTLSRVETRSERGAFGSCARHRRRRGSDRRRAPAGSPAGPPGASAASPSRDRRACCRDSHRRRTTRSRRTGRAVTLEQTLACSESIGSQGVVTSSSRERGAEVRRHRLDVAQLHRTKCARERGGRACDEREQGVVLATEHVDRFAFGSRVVHEVEPSPVVDLALVLERRSIAQPDLLRPARQVGRGDPEVDLVGIGRRRGASGWWR